MFLKHGNSVIPVDHFMTATAKPTTGNNVSLTVVPNALPIMQYVPAATLNRHGNHLIYSSNDPDWPQQPFYCIYMKTPLQLANSRHLTAYTDPSIKKTSSTHAPSHDLPSIYQYTKFTWEVYKLNTLKDNHAQWVLNNYSSSYIFYLGGSFFVQSCVL